jgi:hypothetical protein
VRGLDGRFGNPILQLSSPPPKPSRLTTAISKSLDAF